MDLVVDNLGCARGGIPILQGVSFRLAPGKVLILRGPNGIGKTTLLRTIAGLQPALCGNVDFDRDQITYAAHADGLKPTLTAHENLTFWARIHGTDSVDQALTDLGLADLADRQAQHLSAGQKRRLGLARLLVSNRTLWALDEPTVSLDTDSVALFSRTIEQHCAAGGMALIATHIDLGIDADVLDLTHNRATFQAPTSEEAFL